mmetsp:Transcript_57065/g.139999  ORF Transcript_57065/g.139999 Transcript_57065/m.139999 type:complete len:90 (-) Transcript_57065:146-415(-)
MMTSKNLLYVALGATMVASSAGCVTCVDTSEGKVCFPCRREVNDQVRDSGAKSGAKGHHAKAALQSKAAQSQAAQSLLRIEAKAGAKNQ